MKIKPLIEESYLLRRAYVSSEFEQALKNLTKKCQAKYIDHKFPSGEEHNGWVVPQHWSVKKALVLYKGKVIYDGLAHPLGVITNSASFVGTVSKTELLPHLHFVPNQPTVIPFHFRLQYRPWDSDWGFCLPKTIVDSLPTGPFQIQLETTLKQGTMVVREFEIPGKSSQSILFAAHLDHPGLSNDDLAGCAVGIALMNHIKETYPTPNYTYKLLLTQEIVGSVFYLKDIGQKMKRIKYGLFLEMLGNDNVLHLQQSFLGTTYIDKVASLALQTISKNPKISAFRESAGNDEIVFEAPGIEIPMPAISRWPYPEYHTSNDNMDIISEAKLQESLDFTKTVVSIFEKDGYVKRKFNGLISLANPKYDLYIDPGQIITTGLNSNKKIALFQYHMPRYLTGEHKISEIAEIFQLDFTWLLAYYQKMAEKGLISIQPILGKR